MKLKKLVSAACSAAMLTTLMPAATISDAAGVPPTVSYISDIKVVGATGMDDGSDVNDALKNMLIDDGYFVVDYDLNDGCDKDSDRIYLGYKTTTDRKDAIKDIIIKEGDVVSNTATIKEGDASYQLCPYDGSQDFKTSFGDLNNKTGGFIEHIFYTKDEVGTTAITGIFFSDIFKETDPVSGIDLNKGAFIKLDESSTDLTRAASVYMNVLRAGKLVYDEERSTYYQCFDTGVSWSKAVELCSQLGGHLADCSDEHENYKLEQASKDGEKNLYWLGGTVRKGDIIWESREEAVYTVWAPGMPNYDDKFKGVDEDCVALINKTNPDDPSVKAHFWCDIRYDGNYPENYLDNSYYGLNNFGFICEWNVDKSETATFNGHTYQSFDKSVSWEEAELYCEELGGHLVTISSEEEQKFLFEYMAPCRSEYYWIGAKRAVDGSVKWVNTEKSNYKRFKSDVEKKLPAKETPIVMSADTAFWETREKADQYTVFICEWEDKPQVTFNSHKYKLFDVGTDWEDASEYCDMLGGHLVTITSPEEQNFVCSLLETAESDYCWLGGYRSQSKGFKWVTGEKYGYNNWDTIMSTGTTKDTAPLALDKESGDWSLVYTDKQPGFSDRSCFICEWEKGAGPKYSWINHDLQLFDLSLSWEEAEKYCESLGGHLATIVDRYDEQDIKRVLASGDRNAYWLGGKLDDDDLIWYGDEQSDYSFWAPGQPDQEKYGDYVLIHRIRMNKKPPMSLGSVDNTAYEYNIRNVGFICEWDNAAVIADSPDFADPHVEIIPFLTTAAESSVTSTTTTTTAVTAATTTSSVAASSTSKATASATTSKAAASTTTSTRTSATSKTSATTTTSTSGAVQYGDANGDKKVTVADAVAILQYIANKDKYQLTAAGKRNADCYNVGDGITANDALAIQKLDAKTITSLPLNSAV